MMSCMSVRHTHVYEAYRVRMPYPSNLFASAGNPRFQSLSTAVVPMSVVTHMKDVIGNKHLPQELTVGSRILCNATRVSWRSKVSCKPASTRRDIYLTRESYLGLDLTSYSQSRPQVVNLNSSTRCNTGRHQRHECQVRLDWGISSILSVVLMVVTSGLIEH